jgi:hypothetical protein
MREVPRQIFHNSASFPELDNRLDTGEPMLAEKWFIDTNLRKYPGDDDRCGDHFDTHSEMTPPHFSYSLSLIFANSKISRNLENPPENSDSDSN